MFIFVFGNTYLKPASQSLKRIQWLEERGLKTGKKHHASTIYYYVLTYLRYPGVACDIPSHVYQYTFEPNTQWSRFFSPGAEILEYVKAVAKKYKVDDKVQYNTKVTSAKWIEEQGVWEISTEVTSEDGTKQINQTQAEVVISAAGILNNWKWPKIDGLHDFGGKLLHSASWDSSW